MAVGKDKRRRNITMTAGEFKAADRVARGLCRTWASYVRSLVVADLNAREGHSWRERLQEPER